MKSLQILSVLPLFVGSLAHAKGEAGKVFFTKSIKALICTQAVKDRVVKDLQVKECASTRFLFLEDKTQVKIESVKKPLTTLMKVEFEAKGVQVEAAVVANLEVTSTGKIKRTGWTVQSVKPVSYSDDAILDKTWENDENVRDLKKGDISQKIFKKISADMKSDLKESLNNGADNWGEGEPNGQDTDLELPDLEDGKVILNEQGKVIGYLYSGSISSESADYKVSSDFKYNTKGRLVDYREWSGGYHE